MNPIPSSAKALGICQLCQHNQGGARRTSVALRLLVVPEGKRTQNIGIANRKCSRIDAEPKPNRCDYKQGERGDAPNPSRCVVDVLARFLLNGFGVDLFDRAGPPELKERLMTTGFRLAHAGLMVFPRLHLEAELQWALAA